MCDTAALLLELGGVLFALALLARFASRIGITPIPLYLIAGLAFGDGGLLPLETAAHGFLEAAAEIGVLLLLLGLGLEYSAGELVTGLRASALAGIVDFALNFTPGFLVALALGWAVVPAVLLGGVTFVSSSGIIARVLADLGRLPNRETPAVLAVLVMEDLAMAVYLPVVAVLLAGGGVATGAVSLGVALVAVAAAMVISLRYGALVSRWLLNRSNEALLLAVLGVVLLAGGAADAIKVSAAVAAFLVGVALSGETAERFHAMLNPLRDLFGAAFFVSFGLRVDPLALPPALPAALLLALVTAATKLATGAWAARRVGAGPRGQLRAVASLVTRGEFSVVIAGLGVTAGVGAALGPVSAAYVLVLAVAGPLLTRSTDAISDALEAARAPRRDRAAPAAEAESPETPSD